MVDFNGFKGKAKRLESVDISRLAATIGCGEDHLHAFMEVEAAGSGFDSNGRPKMLFEPHVFYRNLSGDKLSRAIAAGLAYKSWGQKPYPSDSYPRLIRAMQIDESAALKSASWGLGQILAENHKLVGYHTPQAMVAAFMEDEETHLEAMVQFLIGRHIADDLKAHRWSDVARVYNGPGYKKNRYDVKMAAAYQKWRKIKDTPYNGETDIPVPTPQPEDEPVIIEKPVVADPGELEKHPAKSKTVWSWLLSIIAAPFLAFGNLDWRVQIAIVVVVVALGVYAIKRRHDLFKAVRDLKKELG